MFPHVGDTHDIPGGSALAELAMFCIMIDAFTGGGEMMAVHVLPAEVHGC